MTPITNHVQQALSKLTTPFKNKPRFAAWVKSQVTQSQILENMLQQFLAAFDVDTCDLPRLTILGKLVGQTPIGALETFRRLVKTRILANRSDMSAPTLIKIAMLLVDGTVRYRDGECDITIESVGPVSAAVDPSILVSILRSAKMGGVSINLVTGFDTDELLWGTVASYGTADTVHGLAPTSLASGGYLSGVY